MTFFGPDIRNGLPIGLGSMAGFGRRAFTPSVLFAAGEQGFWYDPTDIPVNWRRNLLTRTEEFDNAAWDKNAGGTIVTANAAVAPDGTTTADLIEDNPGSGNSTWCLQTFAHVIGQTYTFSLYVRAAGGSTFQLWIYNDVNAGVRTPTITATGAWQRYTLTATIPSGTTIARVGIDNSPLGGVFVWGAQLDRASTASDYQRIVTPEISFLDYQPQPVMYTDSAGTTPVTAVEQAVGLILDKSKGLVLSGELATNGSFATDSGWTKETGWTISGGKANKAAGVAGSLYQAASGIGFGDYCVITFTVSNRTAGSVIPYIRGTQSSVTASANGTYTAFARANTDSVYAINFYADASFDGSIDDVSVRKYAGNHAIQPGATNRPILRSRYNLGTYSEDLTNAAWQKLASGTGVVPVVTNNYATAPDGTNTATRVQFDLGATPATAVSRLFQNNNDGRTALRTRRYWFKTTDGSTKTIYTTGPDATDVLRTITGTWQQFVLSDTSAQVAAYAQHQFGLNGNTSTSVDLLVWHPELVYSTDAYLPYQRIAAATDYDVVGFPVYLAFDGSDDSLYTGGNVDFSATDKMTVWAGVTKLSDAANGAIFESSGSPGTDNGVVGLQAPGGTPASEQAVWRSRGTNSAFAIIASGYSAPVTSVLTGIGDISGDSALLRSDGVQLASSTSDQGTGNFGSYPLYIGRRNNSSLPFNGRVYALLGRGAATSAALITQADRWVAGKQGRAL